MKKYIIILVALFAISFVSCSKEDKAQQEELQQVTNEGTKLKVQVDENGTKVSMDAAGVFKWQASDKIAVLSNAGTVYQFTASSSGSASEFVCPNKIDLGDYAQYPYSASFAATGDAVTFQIPSTITYVADATNMPMLGKIDGSGVAHFKAVGALLKVIVYGVPSDATQIVFTATNKKVSGAFAIADASVASPSIATAAKGASDNTVTIDFTGNRRENMVFYFPLPTGSIDGFSVALNGTGGTTKTVSGTVAFGRNKILVAPTINLLPAPTTMWKETFTGYDADKTFSSEAIQTGVGYDAVAYGGASITYTTANGTTTTKLYDATLAGGTAPELLISKSAGSFTVAGVPTNGSSYLSITFKANKTDMGNPTTTTEGVTISGSYDALNNYSGLITNSNNAATINLVFNNTGSSNNVRFDDVEVKTAYPNPTITSSSSSVTINAGYLTPYANITGITLTGAIDGNDIGLSIPAETESWLIATLSAGTLSLEAKDYNHTETDRVGHVYLKATGVTKDITVTQKPSIVASPTLTATPGNATFSITWTGDSKAKSYVGYYSTSSLLNPATGTSLTISNVGTAYTATPSGAVSNGTLYYVYIKVNEVADASADKYVASTIWANTTVTPSSSEPEYEWVQVTTLGGISAGEYIIINNGKYLPSTTTTSSPTQGTAPTITSGVIDNSDVTAAMKWTFSGSTSAMNITNAAGKYLCINGKSNTSLRVTDRTNEYTWVIENHPSATGFSLKYKDTDGSGVYRYCATYGSGSDWRTYTTANHANYGDSGKVYFFKKTLK